MLSSSTAKAVPLLRWRRLIYASPYGRGGTEGDGEGNGIQTPTVNPTSIAETNILFVGTAVLDCPLSTTTANFTSIT